MNSNCLLGISKSIDVLRLGTFIESATRLDTGLLRAPGVMLISA